MTISFVCNDIKKYLDEWPNKNSPKEQIKRWPKAISYETLGKNQPGHICLPDENNELCQDVFTVTQSTINKFLNPDIGHPLYPNITDLLNFSQFMNLGLNRTIHLILKMYFEKSLVKYLKKKNQDIRSYYDIQKYTDDITFHKQHFNLNSFKDISYDKLYELIKETKRFQELKLLRSDFEPLINHLISLVELSNHDFRIAELDSVKEQPLMTLAKSKKNSGKKVLIITILLIIFLAGLWLFVPKSDNTKLIKKPSKNVVLNDDELLLDAAGKGNIKTLLYLISKDVNLNKVVKNKTPLMESAYYGQLDAAKILLKYGADANVSNNVGWTPLMSAADQGYADCLQLLVNHKANVNAARNDGWTALMSAAHNNHVEEAQILLKNKANINAKTFDGWTALMSAANNGHNAIIELFMNYNVNINARRKDGWTALMAAVNNGHLETVMLLLNNKANVNATTKDKWTPLMAAVNNDDNEMVKILMQYGADINISNNNGITARILADMKGYRDISKTLAGL
ncbi:MAG: ankyrin repeat domain-containing protein [Candidatus Margulisbacteria bacterium]|nr:ankyrin repeat domain-containing protein [Candidatus Margulisiibacteriota bacterium]